MPSTQPAPAITMIAFDIPKSTSQSVRSDSSAADSFSTTMKESAGRAAVKARNHAARSASRRSALRVGHGAELASAACRRWPATGSNLSAIAAPTVSMGRCCCDLTLPLTPTGTGRGGRRARRCCCDVALPLTPTGAGRGMPLTSTGTGRGTNAGLWDAWKDILHHR